DTRTIFDTGALTKQFTAAAIMLLVEQGKLSLDEPLTTYFPAAPTAWRAITPRHLLTHTSGLPDYTSGTLDYRRAYTEEDLVTFAFGLTLEFPPGSRWNYSNTGYVMLGALARKVSGRFYGDVLREGVFLPLDMRSARVITESEIVPHRAAGYRLENGALKNQEWVSPELNTTADGSLYLSLRDMVAWDASLRARHVLDPRTWAQVFAPVRLNSGKTYPYGFGWDLSTFAGRRAQRHSGGWQGFATYIARYPDADLTIIVLANLAEGNPGRITEGVAAILDPSMTDAGPAPIPDADMTTQKRVEALLASAASGTLTPSEFAYVRAGFFPGRAAFYKERLGALGPLASLTLVGRRELGDDTVHVYEASYASAVMVVRVAVAPDGKLAGFDVSPKPAR
ncbi:MAG: beta-lactamase family protein, partial [Acidobacteria bacterium]|nr:beta-lactamase family protein [Acidobacteriota bacterium]